MRRGLAQYYSIVGLNIQREQRAGARPSPALGATVATPHFHGAQHGALLFPRAVRRVIDLAALQHFGSLRLFDGAFDLIWQHCSIAAFWLFTSF